MDPYMKPHQRSFFHVAEQIINIIDEKCTFNEAKVAKIIEEIKDLERDASYRAPELSVMDWDNLAGLLSKYFIPSNSKWETEIMMVFNDLSGTIDDYWDPVKDEEDINIKETLLFMVNHYGVLYQLKHANSEIFELNEAIINYEDAKFYLIEDENKLKDHIAEEFADTFNMLLQIMWYYDIPEDQIIGIMKSKLKRQKERVKAEEK